MARRWLHLSFVSLFAFGLSACGGGTEDARPSNEPAAENTLDPCDADDEHEFQNIVNFEPRMVGNRVDLTAACDAATPCSFYFNYDEAHSPENLEAGRMQGADCQPPLPPEGTIAFSQPRIGMNQFTGEPVPGGRCDADVSAMNVIAENVAICSGSNGRTGWGASLDITFAPPLDASQWEGIALWVKNGTPARKAFNLSVSDPETSGGAVNPETDLPYCSSMDPPPGSPPVPDSQKCDAFGVAVTIGEEWTYVPASFAAMRQKGFGVPSTLGHVDTESISRVQVLISAGDWDFWIDDFALFRTVE